MEKDEIVGKLREQGFDAVNISGVVTVRFIEGASYEARQKVSAALQRLGYDKSWGIIGKGKPQGSIDKDNIPSSNLSENSGDIETAPMILETDNGQMSFLDI